MGWVLPAVAPARGSVPGACQGPPGPVTLPAGYLPKRGVLSMGATVEPLIPSDEMARAGPVRFPNESAEYRAARTALLAEEIELRRHLERVAAQRRELPPGGEVTGDYRFQTEAGPSDFAGLF